MKLYIKYYVLKLKIQKLLHDVLISSLQVNFQDLNSCENFDSISKGSVEEHTTLQLYTKSQYHEKVVTKIFKKMNLIHSCILRFDKVNPLNKVGCVAGWWRSYKILINP